MCANLQVHVYFNVILVEQLQETICNQEDALLAANEEIRVAKVEKEHSRVKKSYFWNLVLMTKNIFIFSNI